jgi:hypothetical protein
MAATAHLLVLALLGGPVAGDPFLSSEGASPGIFIQGIGTKAQEVFSSAPVRDLAAAAVRGDAEEVHRLIESGVPFDGKGPSHPRRVAMDRGRRGDHPGIGESVTPAEDGLRMAPGGAALG